MDRKSFGVVSSPRSFFPWIPVNPPPRRHRSASTESSRPVGSSLPQAARRLDARPQLWPDEVRIDIETLNLDAASFRQLHDKHAGDGAAIRDEVLGSSRAAARCRTRDRVGRHAHRDRCGRRSESTLGLPGGDRVATLVSLSLTPLAITDGLGALGRQLRAHPATGHAILFGRTIAAKLPDDLSPELALMVMDVCGAPALVSRVVTSYAARGLGPTVAVLGGAGKSGSLSLAAARQSGAGRTIGVVPFKAEADLLIDAGLADQVVIADALPARAERSGGGSRWTRGCHRRLRRRAGVSNRRSCPPLGGTVIFFSMATNFAAAALGAEGLAADVTMLVGNGYVPGHAALALDLIRSDGAVRRLFEARLAAG